MGVPAALWNDHQPAALLIALPRVLNIRERNAFRVHTELPGGSSVPSTCWLRPAATTRPAPSSFAIFTASFPVIPVAPKMRTFSPGASSARNASESQAETPGLGRAASAFVIDTIGNRKAECSGHHRAFRHRAVRCSSTTDEYPLAIAQMPNPVCATDDGEFAGTGIVRAAGQLVVDRFQGRGPDTHDRFGVNSRFGKLFIARRFPNAHSSMHVSLP
jgi:hypothetical protein